MFTKRFLLALIASTLLLPLSGCGCRRNCCNSDRSYAPPSSCCPAPGGTSFSPPPIQP